MFYFIGGPARCGKTTLANRLRAKVGAQTLVTDGIMRALQENLRPEWIPDIFIKVYDPGRLMADPLDRACRLYRRDVAIWPFYRSY